VHGQRRISADTALRLARFFGTSERFWMNLQSRYDLEIEKDRLGPVLDEIHPLTAASLRNARLSILVCQHSFSMSAPNRRQDDWRKACCCR
jgi:hypothetical protein